MGWQSEDGADDIRPSHGDTSEPDSNADTAIAPSDSLVPKLTPIIRFGRLIRDRTNRWIAMSSRVPNVPVFDARDFAWVRELEANWDVIRTEAAIALRDLEAVPPLATVSPDHRGIAPAGRWRSFFLYGYRYRVEENCRVCPRTAELVSNVPGVNLAFLSVLVPHTHLPAHKGVTKALLTCHLGLQVPRETGRCRMRVADRWVEWREGKCLIFDDSSEHEVRNDSDEARIVLLVQFRRPVGPIGWIVGTVILESVRRTRFVQDALREVRIWGSRRASSPDARS